MSELSETEAWIHKQLKEQQIRVCGQIDPFHVYPWSTVMRVPTDAGLLYFKAVMPSLGYEPALTQLIAQRYPQISPRVLAIDATKGWMLTADMGLPLRKSLRSSKDTAPLLKALPDFARLQIEMMADIDEVVRLGVPQRSPVNILDGFEEILADTRLLSSSEYALSPQQQARLRALKPQIFELAESVMAARLPLTIHHDDFHDGNIFLQDGRLIFSDWGDCVITHPFFSLLILMRSVADSLEVTEDAPPILALRDAYLQPWTEYTTQPDLEPLFRQTWRLGMLNRAFSWHRFLAHLEEPYRTRYAYTVPGWLQDFLETMEKQKAL